MGKLFLLCVLVQAAVLLKSTSNSLSLPECSML